MTLADLKNARLMMSNIPKLKKYYYLCHPDNKEHVIDFFKKLGIGGLVDVIVSENIPLLNKDGNRYFYQVDEKAFHFNYNLFSQ